MPVSFLMSDRQAHITQKYYVCSVCWNDIYIELSKYERDPDDNRFLGWRAFCCNLDCDGAGFVSRKGVERRQYNSVLEKIDAYYNLADFFGMPKNFGLYTIYNMSDVVEIEEFIKAGRERVTRTAEQSLKELGF